MLSIKMMSIKLSCELIMFDNLAGNLNRPMKTHYYRAALWRLGFRISLTVHHSIILKFIFFEILCILSVPNTSKWQYSM
jgi:hypothetical protein